MFSLFDKNQEEIVAIFDIGNGSVGGALVRLAPNQPPLLLHTHREPLEVLTRTSSQRLTLHMLKYLKLTVLDLQKEGMKRAITTLGHARISRAHCVFSSPWFISQTKSLKVEKDAPFQVTQHFIDEVVKKEEEQFQQSLKGGVYEGVLGDDSVLLEKKIIHTFLNGYEVESPIGKSAREVSLTFFLSFISKKILDEVESVIDHAFHFKNIQHSSYALASWNAVRDIFHTEENFLFLDITGEVTDSTLTIGGSLVETASFPGGRSPLIRELSHALTVPTEVAVSFLAMHKKATLEKVFDERVALAAEGYLKKWQTQFLKVLAELGKYHTLPKKVYATVDSDVAGYFLEILTMPLPRELNMDQASFEILILSEDILRPYIKTVQIAESDPFIAIESIFISKLV